MDDLTNDEIAARIRTWQSTDWVHPLTCAKDSSHAKLEPLTKDGRVVLTCPTCGYEQAAIPPVVLAKRLGFRLP